MHEASSNVEGGFRAVTRWIEEISAARPEAIAVVHGERRVTYAELNAAASRLARHLTALGVGPETLVGVCMDRSCDWLVAILGLWKAGAAYLPLDPRFPWERLSAQLEQAQPAVLLGTDDSLAALRTTTAYVMSLDEDRAAIAARDPANLDVEVDPRGLACVLYTSGSTGRPKAIAMEHRGLTNLARGTASALGISSESVVLQFYPVTADAALWESLPALTTGGRLVISDREVNVDPARLARLLADERVSVATCPPQTLSGLRDHAGRLTALRSVASASEACTAELATTWSAGRRFFNAYGPAEYTCCASVFECSDARFDAPPPIGRPFEATELYVLDDELAPVPVGVEGELYVGGAGLTRGYHGQPGLTAERFVPDPRADRPGARLYRTGDRCRWLPDGNLAFVGRADHQVKIRGFRVEPAEVSAALERDPAVARAFTMGRRDGDGPVQLVGYVVPRGGAELDVERLRTGVAQVLPDYMIPSAIVALGELPLTRHGKVDRDALPAPQRPAATAAREPMTPSEEIIAGVWSEVLGAPVTSRAMHFFESGGHSLLAVHVMARLASIWSIELQIRLLFDRPLLRDFARAVDDERRATAGDRAPIAPRADRSAGPLSHAQERLWLVEQVEDRAGLYTTQTAFRARGALDLDCLAAALDAVIARHDVLRSALVFADGAPVQRVLPGTGPAIEIAELPGGDERAALVLAQARTQPFDLTRPPLLRVLVVRLGPDDVVLVFTAHHAVIDFASFAVLHRELAAAYDAIRAGRPVELPALPIQYADYAAWERSPAGQAELERQLAHWTDQLAGDLPVIGVPTARPRSPELGRDAAHAPVRLSRAAGDRLIALARQEGATAFMTLLAAWFAVLARYAGQTDLIVGTPVASRSRPETQGLIGLFLNMLPLRLEVRERESFTQLVRRVRQLCLDAYDHQDVPFGMLVQAVNPPRDLAVDPIFQVQFVLQHLPAAIGLSGASLEPLDAPVAAAQFDLTLALVERDGGLDGAVVYRRDLFDPALIGRLAHHVERLVELVADQPDRPIAVLPLLDDGELHTQLVELNRTGRPYDDALLVHQQIARTARRTPDAIAVALGADRATYGELVRRAGRVTRALVAGGVRADEAVGVCMERSIDLVVAMLGVLGAGAAFMPLSPDDPPRRLVALCRGAGATTVLIHDATAAACQALAGEVALRRLPELAAGGEAESEGDVADRAHPDGLAYVLYTSGSTGAPKGVDSTHRGLANRLAWMQDRYGLTADDVVLHKTPNTFDVSMWELVWPLLVGARLALARPGDEKDPRAIAAAIQDAGVTTLHFVPSMLRAFLDQPAARACTRLRRVVCSGEALLATDRERFFDVFAGSAVELHNLYGPTEASIDVTAWACAPDEVGPVPIGRPIANTTLHVLDRALRPTPLGVPGELYIGGIGLARGYRHRPDLTAERFVPSPFGDPPGARLYRTGDLVRYRDDGAIEFLGRLDHQIKLRGVRIELGEIERVLTTHPAVLEAVAVVRRGDAGETLAGYVRLRPEHGATAGELRDFLAGRLPSAFVPAAVVAVDDWPRTRSGKIDASALPAPLARTGAIAAGRAEPAVELIARLFTDVLGTAAGPESGFFALGGHSLLAARLAHRLADAFGVELRVRDVFEAPTPAALARAISDRRGAAAKASPVRPADRSRPLPASAAQRSMWLLDRLNPGSAFYNVPFACAMTGALDEAALAGALQDLVDRHEALHTSLGERDGEVCQIPAPGARLPLAIRDVAPDDLARELGAEVMQPLALDRAPLARAALLRTGPEQATLVLTVHHAATDGWSQAVLARDFAAAYAARVSGSRALLPPAPIQYADYAAWQRAELAGPRGAAGLGFWRDQLRGAPAVAATLPTDHERPATRAYRGAVVSHELPQELTRALHDLARAHDATLFMVLLAAYGVLLHRHTGDTDIVVGVPVANRPTSELEPVVGAFVNTIPLRLDLSPRSFADVVRATRRRVLDAFEHQHVPFDAIVDAIQPERQLGHHPIFQVMFAFEADPARVVALPGLSVALPVLDTGTTRFDATWSLSEVDGRLCLGIVYDTDLYDAGTVARQARRYETLLRAIAERAAGPARPIGELDVLDAEERALVTERWSRGGPPASAERLDAAFERQVRQRPDAPALIWDGGAMSYAELDSRAEALAAELERRGVGLDLPVAVCMERSPEMVTAVLAILRTGGAFVPLDPSYPRDRLAFMLADSRSRWLVTHRPCAEIAPAFDGAVVLADQIRPGARSVRRSPARPDSAAYVLYTSGSTGTPKGVVVSHAAIANRIAWSLAAFRIGPEDRVVQKTVLSFDAAVWELFAPLSAGGCLVLARPGGHRDPAYLAGLIARERVTTLMLVPTLLGALLDEPSFAACRSLRRMFCAGEVLEDSLVARLRDALPVELHNHYGPTEAAIDTTSWTCDGAPGPVPIGRPIAGAAVRVLDRHGQPAPIGVPGELHIGGAGLARGYLARPALTAERFVPDRFADAPGARLYRTGDLVRWSASGALEFLGRGDDQIKLRGHRIELGEIEATLNAHDAVARAAVVVRGSGDRARIEAFVVARNGHAALPLELRAHLADRLPYYMVPAEIALLDALPLLPTGKIDRAALRARPAAAPVRTERTLPDGQLERTIAAIWQEVLGLPAVGSDESFFDLGGNSFHLVKVSARLDAQLGRRVPLLDLFKYPTIQSLARALSATPGEAGEAETTGRADVSRRADRQRAALRQARKQRGGSE